ncbi:hypothetical protein JP0085_08500 [Helicobacter pylori]|nr:hypothetical protein JP0085_08500 [Helicobacter pylori]
MLENSKLQPAKLGKNFDPVDHSNRNFFFSLILSVLLHWLIYFLFEHREDFFPSKPKLVKEISVLGRVDANHKIISIETNKERYLVLLSDKYGLLLDKISPKTSKEELIKEAENNIKNSKLGNLYAGKF